MSNKPKLVTASEPTPEAGLLGGMEVFLHFSDLERIGVAWTRQYVNQLEEEGKFPRRVHLSDNTVAWLKSEVVAWQGERSAMRDAAPAPKAPSAGQPPAQKKLPARQKDQGGVKSEEASDVRAAG